MTTDKQPAPEPVPFDVDALSPYGVIQVAVSIIGEDRVPTDVLRDLIRDYGDMDR